jgi:predicted site-specific integrase-resolvase
VEQTQQQVTPMVVNLETAAKLFGVSDRTIRRWEGHGWITGRRIAKQRFYPFAELEHLAQHGSPKTRKAS